MTERLETIGFWWLVVLVVIFAVEILNLILPRSSAKRFRIARKIDHLADIADRKER